MSASQPVPKAIPPEGGVQCLLFGTDPVDNSAAGDHNYPIAYSRDSIPKIGARIQMKITDGVNPMLKATGPANVLIPPTLLQKDPVQADSWLLLATPSTGKLPNTIKYYSAQEEGKEFKLSWYLSIDGQNTWSKVQETDHTVYVTLGDPLDADATAGMGKHFHETLFNIGCRNADGQSDNSNNGIVDLIYQEFTDQKVCRVIPSQGLRENDPLIYWKDYDINAPCTGGANELLKSENRNGNCGAWSSLLFHITRNQGIESRQVKLESINYANSEGLLVKNWNFVGPGVSNPTLPSYSYVKGQSAFSIAGIPAQGHEDGGRGAGFNVHVIMISANHLYDPSYGTPKLAPMNGGPNYKDYEDLHLAGFYYWGLPTNQGDPCRKNITTESSSADVSSSLLPPSS